MNGKWFGSMYMAAGAVAGLILAVTVSGADASGGSVTLVTPFDGNQQAVINGTVLGDFPYYVGISRITFTWTPYWPPYLPNVPNPAPSNRAYRVAVWQNTTPLASTPTWVPIHVSDHWIDDPNPTTFSFDSFLDFENVCHDCPSMIVVQPETYRFDPTSISDSPFIYTPVSTANSSGVPALIKSSPFLIISNTKVPVVDCTLLPTTKKQDACEDDK